MEKVLDIVINISHAMTASKLSLHHEKTLLNECLRVTNLRLEANALNAFNCAEHQYYKRSVIRRCPYLPIVEHSAGTCDIKDTFQIVTYFFMGADY